MLKIPQVFLERSAARVINTDTLRPPNPNCSVCSVVQSKLVIDPARATLNNLVEDVLKTQLGYGDDFSINSDAGTLYDPELDDNVLKAFGDLGVKGGSFLTVIDDEDENPRVNLSLSVSEQTLPESSAPVQVPQKINVVRRPKIFTPANGESNGANRTNGTNGAPTATNDTGNKRKRSPSLEEPDTQHQQQQQPSKMAKTRKAPPADDNDDLIILDDSGNGAIIIDD